MIDLNDVEKVRQIDTMDSLITTENYDVQFRESLELGKNFEIENPGRKFHEIVILAPAEVLLWRRPVEVISLDELKCR